jgi:hypothetical protein
VPGTLHLGAAAWHEGEQWAFQCKRVQDFGPKHALAEVEKVLALPEAERPVGPTSALPAIAHGSGGWGGTRVYCHQMLQVSAAVSQHKKATPKA